MRHRRRTVRLNRKLNHRNALFRTLMISLVEHGRIKTTIVKAKEVRRHIERIVTKGKAGDLSAYRLLLSRIPHQATVEKIVKEISPRFAKRPGGYTRIIRVGKRPGDMSEMAFLEWVDYDFKTAGKTVETSLKVTSKKKSSKEDVIAATAVKKNADQGLKSRVRLIQKHKKAVRKIQSKSRADNRA